MLGAAELGQCLEGTRHGEATVSEELAKLGHEGTGHQSPGRDSGVEQGGLERDGDDRHLLEREISPVLPLMLADRQGEDIDLVEDIQVMAFAHQVRFLFPVGEGVGEEHQAAGHRRPPSTRPADVSGTDAS